MNPHSSSGTVLIINKRCIINDGELVQHLKKICSMGVVPKFIPRFNPDRQTTNEI